MPVWEPTREIGELDYRRANIATVIWSTGYSSNFRWIGLRNNHRRIVLLGLLYTWGSGRFSGVARDANVVADHIAGRNEASAGRWFATFGSGA